MAKSKRVTLEKAKKCSRQDCGVVYSLIFHQCTYCGEKLFTEVMVNPQNIVRRMGSATPPGSNVIPVYCTCLKCINCGYLPYNKQGCRHCQDSPAGKGTQLDPNCPLHGQHHN